MAPAVVRWAQERAIQLKVILYKNFKVSLRGWPTTSIELLAPVAFILLLLLIQAIPNTNKDENPQPDSVGLLPKCHGRTKADSKCYSLFYLPNDNPEINAVMTTLADRNKLNISTATELSPKTYGYVVGWPGGQAKEVREWIKKNPNMTQGVLDFTSVAGEIKYTLMYNKSCPSIVEKCKDYRPTILRAISEALAIHYGNASEAAFELYESVYPEIAPPSDAVKTYGILFFYCGGMFFFIILLYQIVYEKEHKLRQGMRMMGLRGSIYWAAWFIHSQIINILSTLLLIAAGVACDFAFFRYTNFFVLFLVFWVFAWTMSHLAFLIATLIPTTKLAVYMSMFVFIIGALLMLIFSLFGAFMFPLLYEGGPIATPALWVLSFVPMYNFAKAVFDINNKSFSLGSVTGEGFTWNDLFEKSNLRDAADVPPTIETIYFQLILIGIFTVLGWYFDNTVPGASGGSSEPLWFFFTPGYWGFSQKQAKVDLDVRDAPREGVAAHRLMKIYQKWPFVKSRKDVLALRDFSATIPEGEIFCVLGHNGAGKTTTVSMMTGLFEPTFGDATIYGHSIVSEMDDIRRIMGVCPQHDILWNELTAEEHLEIFADLKGVPRQLRTAVIKDKLESVGLYGVRDKKAGSFSGGMKRRLSVAISCIGEPKIIFMDEPTTGMDPVSRRHVWNLIQELKQNRVIILTTHSMEEADVLGDRIAIMSHGEIKCLGTPLHLKNKYGDGYRINVTARPDAIEEAKAHINELLPGANLVAETNQYLIFGLPHSHLSQIVPFFKIIEHERSQHGKRALVSDCSISHTTLEEVFLKITRQANAEESRLVKDPWSKADQLKAATSRQH